MLCTKKHNKMDKLRASLKTIGNLKSFQILEDGKRVTIELTELKGTISEFSKILKEIKEHLPSHKKTEGSTTFSKAGLIITVSK